MKMWREWSFEGEGFVLRVTLNLCDWLVGMAWGPRDMVIHPLPCLIIEIEFYDEV